MKCPICSIEITMDTEGKTRFCPNCGSKLVMPDQSDAAKAPEQEQSFIDDLNRSKEALGAGDYESARTHAEIAISKNLNTPDGWYLKACSVKSVNDDLYRSCLNRSRILNSTIPFIVVNKESADRIFTNILGDVVPGRPFEDAFDFAVNRFNYVFSKNGSAYNTLIDDCINEIRRRNADMLSNPELVKFTAERFNELDKQLTFTDELSVNNWNIIARSVNEIIPQMFACFSLNLALGTRLATAIRALYGVTRGKWVSMFRPAAIKSIDVKDMTPVITRAQVYFDWARNLR